MSLQIRQPGVVSLVIYFLGVAPILIQGAKPEPKTESEVPTTPETDAPTVKETDEPTPKTKESDGEPPRKKTKVNPAEIQRK